MNPDVAKVIGIREAPSWVKNKGWIKVQVETDSLVIVQAIRSLTPLLSYFGRIVHQCRELLEELKHKDVILYFVKRSANIIANFLAKTTSIISDRIVSRDDIPCELSCVLFIDMVCILVETKIDK